MGVEIWHALKAVKHLEAGRSAAHEARKVKPVPLNTLNATLEHCDKLTSDLIRLQLLTAMRSGELMAMRPCDIDRSGEVWIYTPAFHKTSGSGIERRIGLSMAVQKILNRHMNGPGDRLIFQPRNHHWRFLPFSPATVRKLVAMYYHNVAKACLKANPHPTLKGTAWRMNPEDRAVMREHARKVSWHPHQLRHNAATYLRREVDIESARIALGHTTATMTERYAKADLDPKLRESAVALEGILATIKLADRQVGRSAERVRADTFGVMDPR